MIGELLAGISKIRARVPIAYHGLIIGLYTLMTAMLTYPVITNMTGAIMGTGDAWQVLYILWYTKQAILGGNPDLTITFTNYLFYPNGIPMIFSSFSLFNQLIGVPLQMLFGLAATYNIVWLLSFILAGYGAFLLVRYLTGNDAAAFVSGIVYAFSPYHFEQAQMHMGATTIEWIPFCALFLMKMFRQKDLKSAMLAGVFFILVTLSDSQYMMFMILLAGLLFIFETWCTLTEKFDTGDDQVTGAQGLRARIAALKNMFLKYAVFGFTSLIGVIPANYDLLRIAISGNNFLSQNISDSATYSGDLLGFIVPSPLHPIFGSWVASIYTNFAGFETENITYIGLTVLALSVVAIAVRRREKEVQFWALSAVFFMLMVLGPVLHVMGSTRISSTIFDVSLPYTLVYTYVPFMSDGRTPDRFDVLVMLSFAVLAGYGLARLMEIAKTPRKGTVIALIAAALIVFEFLSVPAISLVDTPAFYQQLGQDTGHYAVVEIPATASYEAGLKCEYYETISDKPMVGGQVPRTPNGATSFETTTPLIKDITYPGIVYQPSDADIFNQNDMEIGNSVLEYYNISYIILHTDYMANISENWVSSDMDLLNETLQEGPSYTGDNLVVYKVPQAPPELFIIPEGGFFSTQYDENQTIMRPAMSTSSIDIVSPAGGQYTLRLNVSSFLPDSLSVSVNGNEVAGQPTTFQFTHLDIPVRLNKGDNTVVFNSTGYNDTNDAIYLGAFVFENVSIAPADTG